LAFLLLLFFLFLGDDFAGEVGQDDDVSDGVHPAVGHGDVDAAFDEGRVGVGDEQASDAFFLDFQEDILHVTDVESFSGVDRQFEKRSNLLRF